MEIIFALIIGSAIGGIVVWSVRKTEKIEDPYLKAELDRRTEEIGELKMGFPIQKFGLLE